MTAVELTEEGSSIQQDVKKDYGFEGLELDDKLTREERDYCRRFIDPNDICKVSRGFAINCSLQYCQQPMPLEVSSRLQTLRARLGLIEGEMEATGERISWTRTVEFCSLHLAETTLIPLGYRQGYPREIDFLAIPERLEDDWIRCEMEEIMQDPNQSSFFRNALKDIEKRGKWKWSGIENQARKEVIDASMPG